jgi:hypothetical protein
MAFITAGGTKEELEEHYKDEVTMFRWIEKLHFRSYQVCTSKQRILSANRGEFPVELRLGASIDRPDVTKESFDELRQKRRCVYSEHQKNFAASIKETPAFKGITKLMRDNLPQSSLIKNVAAFVPTCINDVGAMQTILAAELAMLCRTFGEKENDLSPYHKFPITYDDDHACKSLSDYLHAPALYPWLDVKIGGANFYQLFDLGIPWDRVPSVQELRQMVTLLNVNKDSFIICLDGAFRPVRQAAMEIIGQQGPAGMLCERIDDDDVPLQQPHDWDPEIPVDINHATLKQTREGKYDPSSPSLVRWKGLCHEIKLGPIFGRNLMLYLRRKDVSEDTVMAGT